MSLSPQDRFVDANGLRIHVVDWGGDGPAAVLLHATGFHARVWDPIARALARDHHVLAFDARGHGDSDKPESGYAWSGFVADAVATLEQLGIRGALGVGHSMGATTTACVAAARPDLLSRIVLLDPILFPREAYRAVHGENPLAIAARKRREVWPSREEMIASYRGRGAFATWSEEALRLYVEHGTDLISDGTVRLKCPGRIESQVFGMAPAFDAWSELDRIGAPALFVRGERTETLTPHDAARALGHLRRGLLRTAPGATHFVPMERPEWVVEAIRSFRDALDPEPALPVRSAGLAHLALNVGNLEEMRHFYEEVFGMRLVWQPDPDNVYLSSGRDNLALHRTADGTTPAGGALDHLGFLVERPALVYAAADALRRRGTPLWKEPRRHRDGSCSLYVKDPEGNVVQILYTPDARLD